MLLTSPRLECTTTVDVTLACRVFLPGLMPVIDHDFGFVWGDWCVASRDLDFSQLVETAATRLSPRSRLHHPQQ